MWGQPYSLYFAPFNGIRLVDYIMYFSKLDGVFKHETILLLPACRVVTAVPFGFLELKNSPIWIIQ
jgi:hypothetical protein